MSAAPALLSAAVRHSRAHSSRHIHAPFPSLPRSAAGISTSTAPALLPDAERHTRPLTSAIPLRPVRRPRLDLGPIPNAVRSTGGPSRRRRPFAGRLGTPRRRRPTATTSVIPAPRLRHCRAPPRQSRRVRGWRCFLPPDRHSRAPSSRHILAPLPSYPRSAAGISTSTAPALLPDAERHTRPLTSAIPLPPTVIPALPLPSLPRLPRQSRRVRDRRCFLPPTWVAGVLRAGVGGRFGG